MKNNKWITIYNRIKKDFKNNWIGLTAVAVCFILFLFMFEEVCPSQIWFGLPCPGCGLTRAGILLLKGHFVEAFKMHPFIYVFVLGVLIVSYNRYVRGKEELPYFMPVLIVVIILMLIFFVYRMKVYFPNVEPMIVSEHKPLIDVRECVSSWAKSESIR